MPLLEDFLNDRLDPASFDHAAHVKTAYLLLATRPFEHAFFTYCTHLRALTARAGAEEKYNATITFAALSTIAERMSSPAEDVSRFLAKHPDLLEASTLTRGYSHSRLMSERARHVPLLPDCSI
ncbi:MAG: hypothetical protein N4A61_11710 [Pelagimonas sp.]|jgi:O-acetylhomoserine/O-acetylserine sulfhydrylase-like pyridoxal-dependent enzyme|nr:hypothetical protein [Pelagimonas sp.]